MLIVALSFLLPGCGGAESGGTGSPSTEAGIERTAEKGPVKLVVHVQPAEPRLSDLVEMDVVVTAQPNMEIKPPAFGQAVGDFLIRDYSERPPEKGPGENVRRFHYQLEPSHAGKHLIRSVAVEFVDRRPDSESRGQPTLIESDPLEVNVTSELVDGPPDLANLEPMLPPQSLAKEFGLAWILSAGGVVVILIVAIVFLRKRRHRAVAPRQQSPEEIAHAALSALLAENLPQRGLAKEFFLRLTGIVRQYIEDTTGLRAPEQTTEEFLRDMRSREAFSPERSVRLAEFLEAADMIKYAGQEPQPGQIEDSITRAREFVDMKASQLGSPFSHVKEAAEVAT